MRDYNTPPFEKIGTKPITLVQILRAKFLFKEGIAQAHEIARQSTLDEHDRHETEKAMAWGAYTELMEPIKKRHNDNLTTITTYKANEERRLWSKIKRTLAKETKCQIT